MSDRDTPALAAEDNVLVNEAQAPVPCVQEQQPELHENQHVDVKRAQQEVRACALSLPCFTVYSSCNLKPGMASQFTPSA